MSLLRVKLRLDTSLEIIFGKRRTQQYWELTTDPQTLPKNATWWVMTHMENLKYDKVGNLYGLRNALRVRLEAEQKRVGILLIFG